MNDRQIEDERTGAAPTAAIQALVLAAREKFARDFPGESHCFDASIWDVRHLKDRPATQSQDKLYFTRYGTTDQALPQTYAEVLKSWLVLEQHSLGTMRLKNAAARLFWEAILLRRGNDPTAFRWQELCEEDLSQAELLMREHWTPGTVHNQGIRLLLMVNFFAARGICRPLYYALQTPRAENGNRLTIAGQEARRVRLPSTRALEGVADIYSKYAKSPADRLRACALAILVVTGFRLGELLTLPLDCEVTEISNGKKRYGLRYYKEKTRGGEKMYDVRWLTATGAELAQKAVAEIREITSGARERAKILEQDPKRVPIPGHQWADCLSRGEVAALFGFQNRGSVREISSSKLPYHREGGRSYYRVSDLENYLLSERAEHLWTLDRRDGTYQLLSETLFIAFAQSFHARHLGNPLLVEQMDPHALRSFTVGRARNISAFERFEIREEDGTFCKITSHQFRHWLNDLADKGGLSAELQTRWFGRENPKDTLAYQHANLEERLQWVKDGIRNGEICGTIASVYFALPEEEQDIFLEGHIQAVHFTPLGLCIHDFAIDPCPYYLNCARRCPDYLHTKGNQQERTNLIQVQRRTKQALAVAQAQVAAGNGETAQAWIRHYEETLAGVEAALAVDDDPTASDGEMVRPFKTHPSRFQPL
jgi:hypothetical protein